MENFACPIPPVDLEHLDDRQAFLLSVAPFQLLPPAEIDTVAANLAEQTHPEGAVLFDQEKTLLSHILIVRTGRLERIIEENGRQTVQKNLTPGRIYGGISLLFNSGISTSTVRCIEAAGVYCLDRENFLRLCIQHRAFAGYFVDAIDKGRKPSREAASTAGSAEAAPKDSFLWKTVGDLARTFPACQAGTPMMICAQRSLWRADQQKTPPGQKRRRPAPAAGSGLFRRSWPARRRAAGRSWRRSNR